MGESKMVRRNHFVEIGTVCCFNYGPEITRGLASLKHLSITPIKCELPRSCKTKTALKFMEKQDIQGQWNKTSWAKKIVSADTRLNLTDFDRFKVMLLRKEKSRIVGKEFAKLKKSK